MSYWVTARVTRPVALLAWAARKLAGGIWDARVEVRSEDEIGQLGSRKFPESQFEEVFRKSRENGPRQHRMSMRTIILATCVFLVSGLLVSPEIPAQQFTQDESTYGTRFFDQLRNVFGQFRDADLQRVFDEARPIECSELVGRKGEWRQVAFFNEDRKLGDWYRENLEEVKSDLAVFSFSGNCTGRQSRVRVATEFPTAAGTEAYNNGRVQLQQVDVTVNDPVDALFNARTMAYTFELPYLFLTNRESSRNLYSLLAPNRDSSYATDVVSRWDCKAVSSKDVTYRFMICRIATVPSAAITRKNNWEPSFGASGFFILSDGTEAQTSVNLSFGDGSKPLEKPAETAPEPPGTTSPPRPTLKRPKRP